MTLSVIVLCSQKVINPLTIPVKTKLTFFKYNNMVS